MRICCPHSLLRLLRLLVLFSWQIAIIGTGFEAVELLAIGILRLELKSKVLELSKLMSTLTELYLLLKILRLISSINLDSLIT